MSSPLTTHALNTATGKPAAGLNVTLYRMSPNGDDELLKTTQCDDNGRIKDLIQSSKDEWRQGDYRLRFETRKYFSAFDVACFYPYCDIVFTVTDTTAHYHVPLLISPYGYSTYRGS